MRGEELFSIIVGGVVISVAVNIVKSMIIYLYQTYKAIGRIFVSLMGAVITQFITMCVYEIEFVDLTWGSIGIAGILACLFPNARNQNNL